MGGGLSERAEKSRRGGCRQGRMWGEGVSGRRRTESLCWEADRMKKRMEERQRREKENEAQGLIEERWKCRA